MDFEQLIQSIDADIYQRLKTAVELSKWPSGEALTAEQKALSMQAVIVYENKHLGPSERSGYIEPRKPGACAHGDDEQEAPLRWETE